MKEKETNKETKEKKNTSTVDDPAKKGAVEGVQPSQKAKNQSSGARKAIDELDPERRKEDKV